MRHPVCNLVQLFKSEYPCLDNYENSLYLLFSQSVRICRMHSGNSVSVTSKKHCAYSYQIWFWLVLLCNSRGYQQKPQFRQIVIVTDTTLPRPVLASPQGALYSNDHTAFWLLMRGQETSGEGGNTAHMRLLSASKTSTVTSPTHSMFLKQV